MQVKARRVLVVDDHLDTAHSYAFLLREMGHTVQFAINGYAALSIAEKFRPEVVILDMLLPDFFGADLARSLRSTLAPHPLRIIAVTGRAGEEACRRATQSGSCDEFMLKPLEMEALGSLLNG